MTKHVKNPAGGVHSVNDDFEAPEEWGKEGEDWTFLSEADAKKADERLFGGDDPAVEQAKLHNRGDGVGSFPADVRWAGIEEEHAERDAPKHAAVDEDEAE